MRSLIFANGEADSRDLSWARSLDADLTICADGGIRHALAAGIRPHAVVGDLDSLPPDVRGELEAGGTRFVQHPTSKDETDLEIALLYAANRSADRIVVVGVRGGRVDHELGNLLLLAHPRLEGIDVRLRAGSQEVVLVRERVAFCGVPGDLLSLLPVGGDAQGVTTHGLEYALANEPLQFGPARGVSNVFVDSQPWVSVQSGLLLAVHTRQET